MDPTSSYQKFECPQEFTDRLNEVGGVNRYDEPNFKIVWSQGGTPDAYYRAGGVWEVPGQPTRHGYRDLLLGGGTPSWCLLQWQDAIEYGTPEMYYMHNHDRDTGYQTLGEYPYFGRYRVLYNLRWQERTRTGLKFEAMPLNSYLIDTIVPIIMQAKEISWQKYKAVMADLKEREEKAYLGKIEDAMRASSLPFGGAPVSYNRQGCRTSLVDKKIEAMQRNWNKIATRAAGLAGSKGRGLLQK